jgi:LysM repeat protein
MVPHPVEKIKHLFEKMLHLSVVGYIFLLSNKCSKTFPKVVDGRSKTMSAMTINSVSNAKTIDFQGFSANPSVRLNRRGRLARTLVVLSLAIVVASVAGGEAGANTESSASKAAQFITVTVAPGETIWSLATALADGRDQRTLVSEILEVNNLDSVDLSAGQELRIPLA